MPKQKTLQIITAVLILMVIFSNISIFTPESKNYQIYTQALNEYNNNDFLEAYHLFGNISRFSKIKPAATYRQALCADKFDNKKFEMKKYKEVIKSYPNSILSLRAKYLKAQLLYETKKFRAAKKEFQAISSKNPKTDYAIAAQYYLGLIELEKAEKIKNNNKKKIKTQNKAISYLKVYLREAPTGKFSINCIEKWISLNRKLNNEDNLLIAKVYQKNQDYKNAQKYLKLTNLSISWPYFVENAYETKNYSKVKYYTEQGLKGKGADDILINESKGNDSENKDIYEAIDLYLKISNDPKTSLSYLLSISKISNGYDYLLYKNCKNLPAENQTACFATLYYKYPNGQFAAEALANIFYDKVKSQKYFMAKKLGKTHLSKFSGSKSAPRVMFWMAKVAEATKNYEDARNYYRRLIRQYPDDYYAYHAFLSLNRFRYFDIIGLRQKNIEFPYKNSQDGVIIELAKVKDYGLINQLCKDDKFIQSWLAYLQGNFSQSAVMARDAMEELPQKPDRTDLRWRLVYPVHYYDGIKQDADAWGNDPILILSIVREESYFNPNAKSPVGAIGLMQLMPATAKEAGNIAGINVPNEKLLLNPDINIRLGNVYYSRLKKALFDKDILAVPAYNGGLGSVSQWKSNLTYNDVDEFVEQIPYPETQNYLKKVYRSYWNYLRIYDGVKF